MLIDQPVYSWVLPFIFSIISRLDNATKQDFLEVMEAHINLSHINIPWLYTLSCRYQRTQLNNKNTSPI